MGHFFLPFIIAALSLVHLPLLHKDGSNNPLGIYSKGDKIPFYPYFVIKDVFAFFSSQMYWVILIIIFLQILCKRQLILYQNGIFYLFMPFYVLFRINLEVLLLWEELLSFCF